ncbi:hypothetical protein H8356DRAFT_1436114 [Neocallimastix lanati (nom. inval.)]|nr:hypothetical protein H8356DRAFT_1436114 [Neocallimastix sp. JGI-2020a]
MRIIKSACPKSFNIYLPRSEFYTFDISILVLVIKSIGLGYTNLTSRVRHRKSISRKIVLENLSNNMYVRQSSRDYIQKSVVTTLIFPCLEGA